MSKPNVLVVSLAQIKLSLSRSSRVPAVYAAARARHRVLASYDGPCAIFAAFTRTAPPLDPLERDALVGALVAENQAASHPSWQSLLLVAFERMLFRIRGRLGRPGDPDLDQSVLLAFLNALRSVRNGAYVSLAIRWATEGEVFAARRAERRAPRLVPFKDDRYLGDPYGVDGHAHSAAAEVVRIIEAEGNGELLDVLLSTRATDESLTKYVAREYAGHSEAERAAAYYRLRTARTRIIAEVRARLAPRSTAA